MEKIESDNKRIAKNAIVLYVRMIFVMVVSLYSSRVVLATLGIEDFGLYNVVGGIVAMISFLSSSMSGATSRFITYNLGQGDGEKTKKTFSSALTIHLLIAIVIFVLGETVGLWYLENKLVVPEGRMFATRAIFQFSLISVFFKMVQIPYNACILAYEKLNVYAYVEMFGVVMKLLIICSLTYIPYDNLVLYGCLMMLLSILILCTYTVYCLKNFTICSFRLSWDKKEIQPMLKFSGWDIYGNMSVVARTEGINLLLNFFFGPALNAARGIAVNVQNVIMGFGANMLTAFRPQIVKSYATEDYDRTSFLVINASKYCFILLLFFTIPLIYEMPFVLHLWLKEVPDYTVIFCRLTLLFNFFGNMSSVVISAIHATGKIQRPSLINGSLYLSVIPLSYFLYKQGFSPSAAYILNIITVFVGMISNVHTLHLYLPKFKMRRFFLKALFPCLFVFCVSFGLVYLVNGFVESEWGNFLIVGITSSISIVILSYFFILDDEAKSLIIRKIKKWSKN